MGTFYNEQGVGQGEVGVVRVEAEVSLSQQ